MSGELVSLPAAPGCPLAHVLSPWGWLTLSGEVALQVGHAPPHPLKPGVPSLTPGARASSPCPPPLCPLLQAVEKLVQGAESGCHSEKERQIVLNCSRLLTRVLPYIFEDPDWRGFFWSTVPGAGRGGVCGPGRDFGGVRGGGTAGTGKESYRGPPSSKPLLGFGRGRGRGSTPP